MKLLIYYSLSGNIDLVANKLRLKGYDTIKLKTKWLPPKHIFPLMMCCGFLALIGKKMKLIGFNVDLNKYDEVVIASPIWNGRISCPINTVLNQLNFKDKKVSIILSSASGKAKPAIRKINKKYKPSNLIVLREPKKNPLELNKLDVL